MPRTKARHRAKTAALPLRRAFQNASKGPRKIPKFKRRRQKTPCRSTKSAINGTVDGGPRRHVPKFRNAVCLKGARLAGTAATVIEWKLREQQDFGRRDDELCRN